MIDLIFCGDAYGPSLDIDATGSHGLFLIAAIAAPQHMFKKPITNDPAIQLV